MSSRVCATVSERRRLTYFLLAFLISANTLHSVCMPSILFYITSAHRCTSEHEQREGKQEKQNKCWMKTDKIGFGGTKARHRQTLYAACVFASNIGSLGTESISRITSIQCIDCACQIRCLFYSVSEWISSGAGVVAGDGWTRTATTKLWAMLMTNFIRSTSLEPRTT